ncbi:hypothetical protein PRZ48_007319 [Zasmidium cellare]|uniref:Uncharacterized protein n=1 Tax=Zasmidium cellare TaxID=395010 RepID=A0ABR0EK03_ZASCE|nr:hypothetical protein PRZ48_007319 [Zasmidium cellare]
MGSPLVLITGVTGHLGFKVLVLALQVGYKARAAIRKADQESRITSAKSIQPYAGNLTFVVAPDITAKDAYDEAAQSETWSGLFYNPAIKGTTTLDIVPAPSKSDSESSIGRFEAYAFSKIFAHHAATEFMEARKPSYDLVRITSGYVQGANELNITTSHVRNGSNNALMQVALGEQVPPAKLTGQVLLDDVARAHVASLLPKVKVHGATTNFIIAGNGGKGIPWEEIADEIREQFPEEVATGKLKPVSEQESLLTSFDVGPSERALGFRFAGKKEMVKSLVGQYLMLLESEQKARRPNPKRQYLSDPQLV